MPYKKTVNLENLKLICKKKDLAVSTLFFYYFFVEVDQIFAKRLTRAPQ